jgi:hypothetical protein
MTKRGKKDKAAAPTKQEAVDPATGEIFEGMPNAADRVALRKVFYELLEQERTLKLSLKDVKERIRHIAFKVVWEFNQPGLLDKSEKEDEPGKAAEFQPMGLPETQPEEEGDGENS